MRPTFATSVGLISLLLVLSGCDERDPYRRTDVCQPTGASSGILAAQVANPLDLVHGHGAPGADAHGPTQALEHLWIGQPRALNPLGSSNGSASSGGASASGSGS